MLTLSINSLSNLVDTHIIDIVIAGNNIHNTTISSISTSRTETTTTPTTNRSPVLTAEGAPLVAFGNNTVVSIPEDSSQRRMSDLHENLDNEYDSDDNIGPFFDAIPSESPSLDKALMGNDNPNSNISIPPDRSLINICNTNGR